MLGILAKRLLTEPEMWFVDAQAAGGRQHSNNMNLGWGAGLVVRALLRSPVVRQPPQLEASVLPPFIIEQIRQREERERARQGAEQPRLELPLPGDGMPPRKKPVDENDEPNPDRGVVVIDVI